jgi:hypothetical protein
MPTAPGWWNSKDGLSIRSRLKIAASAFHGDPSVKVTPDRSLKV